MRLMVFYLFFCRLIQNYILREEAGTMTTESVDNMKVLSSMLLICHIMHEIVCCFFFFCGGGGGDFPLCLT